MEPVCPSLSEWLSHGFGEFELPISLMGYASKNSDCARVRRENPFVKSGWTYIHMSF